MLNLEPEGPQRFLEMSIKCVGTEIVVSFFNKVADDWVKTGRCTSPLRTAMYQVLPSKLEFVAQYEGCWSVALGLRRWQGPSLHELHYEAALSG